MTRTFDTEWLRSIIYKNSTDAEIIINEIAGSTRWNIKYLLVFKFEDKYYEVDYFVGATENQDQEAFDDDDGVCTEVFPHLETHIVYKPHPSKTVS